MNDKPYPWPPFPKLGWMNWVVSVPTLCPATAMPGAGTHKTGGSKFRPHRAHVAVGTAHKQVNQQT